MRRKIRRKELLAGTVLLAVFAIWTALVRVVDVQDVGPKGTAVGFATVNVWFHRMTGVHMLSYTLTDWLGLVPILICMCFGVLGLVQLIRRRALRAVDPDILLLGAYYMLVILCYLLFETVPINYRPLLIDGRLEASYPSSTALLVLSVMPTLKDRADRRISNPAVRKAVTAFVFGFSSFMVTARLISGVHWLTDIVGSVLLSSGLHGIYRSLAAYAAQNRPGRKSEVQDGVQ